ncbi:F0F1 ATP synthase subunit epsilon [Microbulbifer variabilis]|uniref:F0F1 ATP synthase subunit epsilon n=1 Tax=Microbulbifer variabilis TaxID=266805 RepID=UPI001CFDB502|nr:hypothetical protein [Microbulbifer variabilis]
MKTFSLMLISSDNHHEIDDLTSFVGEDSSGRFGILAGHQRLITSLVFGLMYFRRITGEKQYLAVPGGLLYFLNDRLQIFTRHYLLSRDYGHISALLRSKFLEEEQNLHMIKESLRRMEESILRHLWELSR